MNIRHLPTLTRFLNELIVLLLKYLSSTVVNIILHNIFSNKHLSRYNSDSLDYQCQHTATIP